MDNVLELCHRYECESWRQCEYACRPDNPAFGGNWSCIHTVSSCLKSKEEK